MTTQPFSLGRLVGDLVVRYAMPSEHAIEAARNFAEVLDVARATRDLAVVDSDELRRAVDELLEGRTVAEVAGELGATNGTTAMPEPIFKEPPTSEEVRKLEDSAAAYASHLLAEAAYGRGEVELVESVAELLAEIERGAYERAEGPPEVRKAIAMNALSDATALFQAGADAKAVGALGFDIRDVLRWIASWLREIPRLLGDGNGDEDGPRDTPPPTGFGEILTTPGYQLEQDLREWKALRLTEDDDEMRISSSFRFLAQSGTAPHKEDVFARNGQAHGGDGHVLGRVNLPLQQTGTYYGIQLLTERDSAADDESAKKIADLITKILGSIASGVTGAALGQAATATGIPGAGLFGSAIQELVFGPVLNAAGDIVGKKLREAIRKGIGPEVFYPIPVTVDVHWIFAGATWEPLWIVKVQGYFMGRKLGRGEIRSMRQGNGMPYTKEIGGNGRYTYQFRFRVD